jgi:hypothetical protein
MSRRAARLGVAGVWLLATGGALAQQADSPRAISSSRSIDQSGLRLGNGADLPDEVRRSNASGPSSTLAPAPAQTFYKPFSRGSEDRRDATDDGREPSVEEVVNPPDDTDPGFDLFEGPDGSPAPRNNLATAPAAAGGAVPAPGDGLRPGTAATSDRAAEPNAADRQSSLLIDAQRRSVPSLDLAVPAGPTTLRSRERIGGRINLPVTSLRPTVPLSADDAFAPVGNRVGSFVLYSTLDQSLGASSNLSRSPNGASGGFSETQLSARLLSDWSLHQAELNALASYRRNFEGEVESEPLLSLDGRLRLDVDRLTTATLTGAIQYRQEDPSDLSPLDSATDRPDILTYSAGAKVEREFGRTKIGLDGTSVRETTSRDDAAGFQRLDENYTTTTAGLRAGYEISPAVQPFVAGSIGKRVFDQETDFAGRNRDSLIESLRGGLAFDLGEKFLGEVAGGYAWNVPDDDALETTGSPTIDARIAWSPQRGTDVVFSAATSFDPDTTLSSTSTLYEGAIALRHRVTARTDLTGTLSASYRDADLRSEREKTYAAEAGFVHWINRSLAFTGLVRHERLDGERPGSDYTANSAKIGLRLQR